MNWCLPVEGWRVQNSKATTVGHEKGHNVRPSLLSDLFLSPRGGYQVRGQHFVVDEPHHYKDESHTLAEEDDDETEEEDDSEYERCDFNDSYEASQKRRGSILSSPFLDNFQEEVHGLVNDYRNDVRKTFRELKESLTPPINSQHVETKHVDNKECDPNSITSPKDLPKKSTSSAKQAAKLASTKEHLNVREIETAADHKRTTSFNIQTAADSSSARRLKPHTHPRGGESVLMKKRPVHYKSRVNDSRSIHENQALATTEQYYPELRTVVIERKTAKQTTNSSQERRKSIDVARDRHAYLAAVWPETADLKKVVWKSLATSGFVLAILLVINFAFMVLEKIGFS
ncbi:hypothetical protein ACA910_012859 [Epithemia clementina (nom. ined.)]